MRAGVLVAATTVFTMSCSGGSGPTAGHSPSPSPSTAASASPGASPIPAPADLTFGLVLSGTTLELIDTSGHVTGTIGTIPVGSATVAPPSAQSCGAGMDAILQPPVSATVDKVYYRNGDTRIQTPVAGEVGGQGEDVTTVPGGPTKVSFFSVSPDNQRIAVLVEDLSPATTVSIRLYVEDLRGAGHHADIYSTTTPKKGGTTLWPMGWHQGNLVLAVVAPCAYSVTGPSGAVHTVPVNRGPTEWHVASAVTGKRLATIGRVGCTPSFWPSPAGVACVDPTKQLAYIYDWAGKVAKVVPTRGYDLQSGRSPNGESIFLGDVGTTRMVNPALSASNAQCIGPHYGCATVQGNGACLWIDEEHVLGPDAVIWFPSGRAAGGRPPASVGTVAATVTRLEQPLATSGACAGRFPGGL